MMVKDFVKSSKAISAETRVRILKLLESRELCVCQLMAILKMGQSTVSKHLGILKDAGLVEVRKEWTWSFYRLSRKRMKSHGYTFLRLLSSVLNDDVLVLRDEERLREVVKKDIRIFCNTGKGKQGGENMRTVKFTGEGKDAHKRH